MKSGCVCGFDPNATCQKHPCRCAHCKEGKVANCHWRLRHTEYIHNHYVSKQLPYVDLIKLTSSLLTYCQVAEMKGAKMPSSQRERNLINILAAGSSAQPLANTLAILIVRSPWDGLESSTMVVLEPSLRVPLSSRWERRPH